MQKGYFVGVGSIIFATALVLYPAFERASYPRQHAREYAPWLLASFVQGVQPAGKGAILSLVPRLKRNFSAFRSDSTLENENRQKATHIHLQSGMNVDFVLHNSAYHFQVQSIDDSGVTLQILNSSSWFLPDKTVSIPWKTAPLSELTNT